MRRHTGINEMLKEAGIELEVFICGNGTSPTCKHKWDGPISKSKDGTTESATCSKCGAVAINTDLLGL